MTVSHYEIVEEIGRGGMGVVYKARDVRLGRTVALKLLPKHLSSDAEAKSRFLQEGRAASILDHSNICTIYDVGETDDGELFMAMAFVDGRPLSDLIAQRPLELPRALDIAVAIGEGLEHSHAAGVVHRDMKPANVMVTSSNGVKILDFGLARLQGATLLTASGTTLGTAAYMSPEQAQGQRADARTDIWALGVILYEMVSGIRPFKGEYQQALTYSIVNDEPEPLTSLRTGLPLEVDRIASKAISKDPAARYQHVDEFLVDLRSLRNSLSDGSTLTTRAMSGHAPGDRGRSVWPVIAGIAAIVAILSSLVTWLLTDSARRPDAPMRFTVETGPMPAATHPSAAMLAISPDGSTLAYERQEGSSVIVLRKLDSFTETVISGSDDGRSPFFSPDGSWLGFLTDTELRKFSLETGRLLTVASVPPITHGASWGWDDKIYIGLLHSLASVPSNGGEIVEFASLESEDLDQYYLVWPTALPNGNHVLATTVNNSGRAGKLWAINTTTGQKQFLLDGGNAALLSPDFLVIGRQTSLWAARLDFDPPSLRSSPVRVFENVLGEFAGEPSLTMFAVSASGILAVVPNRTSEGQFQLAAVDEQGNVEPVASEPGDYLGMSISPDGSRIATTRVIDEARQVAVYDVERQMWTTTTSGTENWWPAWSADGGRILMTRLTSDSTLSLASQRFGSHDVRIHLDDGFAYQARSWIPGSETMILQRGTYPGPENFDIVTMAPGEDPQPLIATTLLELHPAISPNGKWIAYASSASESNLRLDSSFEVFVRALDSPEAELQVSSGGGWAPRWTRDGKRLFYEARNGIFVLDWDDPLELRPGTPRLYYDGPFARSIVYGINYDVGPDGKPVVLEPESEIRNIRLVTGWLDELERILDNE